VKKSHITLIVIGVYSLIIFLPPIIYGYVYPNNGDDTAFHLAYFDKIRAGIESIPNYFGQKMVGYPLVWISDLTNIKIDTLYLWVNLISLWLVGISNYILVRKYISWYAGLISIPMVMFVVPSTLNLYDNGGLYDLITVGIVLPLVIYSFLNLLNTKKWYWLVSLLITSILIIVIHTMAVYGSNGRQPIPTFSQFALIFSGNMVIWMLVGSLIIAVRYYKSIDKNAKLTIVLVSIPVIILAILDFTGVLGWSIRISIDLAIALALLTSCLLGTVCKIFQDKFVLIGVAVLVIGSSFPLATSYLGYNSAIKPIDKNVIEYVNSLEGKYYSCSPEVAPWVYSRFVSKIYKEGSLPYIERNEPMTNRTSPDALDYWWKHGAMWYPREYKKLSQYQHEKEFIQDNIIIKVKY
jgi:hypothetical protein